MAGAIRIICLFENLRYWSSKDAKRNLANYKLDAKEFFII